MAYGRNRRTSGKGRKTRTYAKTRTARSTRKPARRVGRAKSGSGKRAGAGRRDVVTIRVIQEAPQQLSPLTQQLLDQQKVVLPRRARF